MNKLLTVFILLSFTTIIISCGDGQPTTSRRIDLSSFLGEDSEIGGPGYSIPGKINCNCKGTSSDCIAISLEFTPLVSQDEGKTRVWARYLDKYPKVNGDVEFSFSGCTRWKSYHCIAEPGTPFTVTLHQPRGHSTTEKTTTCNLEMPDSEEKIRNF